MNTLSTKFSRAKRTVARHANQQIRDLVISLNHMNHSVYILECVDKTLYVGCTNNLERRLIQHNNSKSGAHYTKIRRPIVLRYSETFPNLKEARGREAELKRWGREKKLNLIKSYPPTAS